MRTYFARQNGKRVKVGKEVHITFSNARKSFYCGSIKPFSMNETIGKLFDRYSYTFCHANYIGKFEVDEAHTFCFNGCQYLFTFSLILLLCHGHISCFILSIGYKYLNSISTRSQPLCSSSSYICGSIMVVNNIFRIRMYHYVLDTAETCSTNGQELH